MKKRLGIVLAAAALILALFETAGEKRIKEAAAGMRKILSTEKTAGEEKDAPVVALTFDDGPSARYTSRLLDGLKKRDVKASFFLLGKNLEGNEEVVRRMHREGHLIGNHTYNHVQLSSLSETKAREEILKTNNAIYEITGAYPQYMRPPFGAWKKNLELCVEKLPVFWNIDFMDRKTQDVPAILKIALTQAEDGSIILMHDEYETSVEAALAIVDRLQEKGYRFVTVDYLITP